jgi:hypothetical protein
MGQLSSMNLGVAGPSMKKKLLKTGDFLSLRQRGDNFALGTECMEEMLIWAAEKLGGN